MSSEKKYLQDNLNKRVWLVMSTSFELNKLIQNAANASYKSQQ